MLSYVAMLAVLKINAAYVPLDVGFPADRLAYIAQDANVHTVLTTSHLRDRLGHLAATPLCLGDVESKVATEAADRLTDAERGSLSTSSATSSTRRARRGGRKAWRSSTPALSTSCASRPRSTGCG
ncbi:AMP-binding protein [Phytohabitans flavus]|uniref:AMP-binding protein n=1 Tax=Phytohabitans flavus TaxID=1076124 RepID=UPI00363092CF